MTGGEHCNIDNKCRNGQHVINPLCVIIKLDFKIYIFPSYVLYTTRNIVKSCVYSFNRASYFLPYMCCYVSVLFPQHTVYTLLIMFGRFSGEFSVVFFHASKRIVYFFLGSAEMYIKAFSKFLEGRYSSIYSVVVFISVYSSVYICIRKNHNMNVLRVV